MSGRLAIAIIAINVAASSRVMAQASDRPHTARLASVPLGALPPVPTQMPASRGQSYWGLRLQAGRTQRPDAAELNAYAAGIDFQWQGGSVFGITGGYQAPDCASGDENCGGHTLFGARARFNVVTGGPTVAGIIGDYSANTTLGAELGFGYAPRTKDTNAACVTDFGVPVSVAMLQTVRLVGFISPGIAWDFACAGTGVASSVSLLTSLGVGVQQLWFRGLDVSVGLQRIYRGGAGLQLGVTVSYVRLP